MSEIISTNLPVFTGESWDDHVNEWITASKKLEDHLWYLGSIASSITVRYGDRAIPEFAQCVDYSPRRIWELAATYKAWEKCDRAHDLSFKHHTIAAREENPEEAIEIALASPKRMSSREFESALKGREQQGAELVETVDCPACQGSGRVPAQL